MVSLPLSVLSRFPPVDSPRVDRLLAEALAGLNRKIVVLDDDPTGVQTVHDVSVYTRWDHESVRAGFDEVSPIFFILTNSRGFTREETVREHAAIGRTLAEVARETGKDYVLISRSDSTMRGHYPLETETLRMAIEQASPRRFDGEIICPFFKEGGRFTIDSIHYVREGEVLTPAGQTEFARDKSFGYHSSHIGEYVEEKTGGRFTKASCTSITLDDLRGMNIAGITGQLLAVSGFNKVIVNAVDYVDVKIFALAFCAAVRQGKEFMFRSAAAVTKVLGGGQRSAAADQGTADPL